MPPHLSSIGIAASFALSLVALPSSALALERQWHVGIDALAASLSTPADGYRGLGGGAHVAYGVNDWLNLELGFSAVHTFQGGPSVLDATMAAYYTIDVIEWIPYFGVFAGGYRFSSEAPSFGGGLALGLDYQFHRSFSVGAQARLHEIFAPDPFGTTTYGTLALRVEYLWGF